MADSAPTLRNRKPPAADSTTASAASPDTKKPAPPARAGILTYLITFLALVVALGVTTLAGLYLYELNPNEYFYPNPVPPWEVVPGDTPGNWTVDFSADLEKRDAVVAAFKHAWLAYERDAMGCDEYHPIGHKGTNLTSAGGIGYTVVDSLDTMLIMGLDDEYARARAWVENHLSFDRDAEFNTFETTIRVLGGLLSAYDLTEGDPLYLSLATDLGERLLPVFDTPAGLPYSLVNLAQRKGVMDPDNRGLVSTAEAASLQLEFRYLAFLTEREEFWEKAEEVMNVIRRAVPSNGLATIFMSMQAGRFMSAEIRLGSRGDSYYEYLLKQYLQTGGIEGVYRDMYRAAMDGIHTNMIGVSNNKKLTYTLEIHPRRAEFNKQPLTWVRALKQDHLACFLGGSLMLGATTANSLVLRPSIPPKEEELDERGKRDWATGAGLVETCVDTYRTASGLAPEIVYFRDRVESRGESDWYIKDARPPGEPPVYDARYILRPETVESLFLAWRLTGHPRYREYGWQIFQAIEKHCRVPSGGYASVLNVEEVPVKWEDKMETFLMSETLKYLYLLFSDDKVLPLDEYVFNTEAHPLPIFRPDNIRVGGY
ncbi:glycoside hydrolase family 47 protein [Roridomyces roridus]|uniref:alpha-1,2-Mannosidase n=1 Tax=Roridomyces roridus TaxID=1738132 RepID=A0AAD7BL50_9AGAR|nr:glycoside hydrolase family 47 protein [Roridomyces roridus]